MKFNIGKVSVDAVSYGSQGSAILGIRDSGKTYTATLLAEKIFEAGIPFVVFDPIGVWRFLRVPGKGKGYPVVVAGGQDGDLSLTVNSAPEIVRAAMKNGVSLVIDLFDINLSKADWKRIVTACVRVLLHENGKHGLRHIFIEEASEFCPQRVGPDQGQVYAEIEKLARMGGNSRLGYTLINQRAEEVNKAVLELCDNLFLHRQKGRNSLTALSKWLDIGNVKEHKEIIDTLSTLETGKCWAWMAGTERPVLVKVPEKNSLHPDRRIMRGDKEIKIKSAIDVKSFVAGMRESLGKAEEDFKANDPSALKKKVFELEKQIREKGGRATDDEIKGAYESGKTSGYALGVAETIEKAHQVFSEAVTKTYYELKGLKSKNLAPPPKRPRTGDIVAKHHDYETKKDIVDLKPFPFKSDGDDFTGPERLVISSLGFWKSIGHDTPLRAQVSATAGYTPSGSSFIKAVSSLKVKGLIEIPAPGCLKLHPSAPQQTLDGAAAKERLLSIMDGPKNLVISALKSGDAMRRDDAAKACDYTASGSSFIKAVSNLSVLGIVKKPSSGMIQLSDWVQEVLL